MNIELEAAIADVLTRAKILLDEDEIALFSSVTDDMRAAKILAAHWYNLGHFAKAIAAAETAFRIQPSPENESNLISALMLDGAIDKAIAIASSKATTLDPVRQASLMSELLARTNDVEKCRKWGLKALNAKDQSAPKSGVQVAPTLRKFNIETPQRNVISFSLWGNREKYLRGAIENAIAIKAIYPGWTARFYIDQSVPKPVQKKLMAEGAELRGVGGLPADEYGLFWRFLVEDDEAVSLYLSRDADSVVNIKERAAVADWLASGKPFHVMRDYRTHSELVLAGMWGAHRGNIGKMSIRIKEFRNARAKHLNSRTEDQLFLRDQVWPLMRDRLCCHDSFFGFQETHKFRADMDLGPNRHIGQNMNAVRAAKSAE